MAYSVNSYENDVDQENMEVTIKEGDDLFIDMIESRPWLYDKSSSDYRDQLKRYNAWKDIGLFFNDTAENCEKRWQRLYQNYCREKLLRIKESRSGSARTSRRSWSLFDRMESLFKKNQHEAYRTYSNVTSTTGNAQNPASCYSKTKNKNRVRRKSSSLETVLINNVNATTHLLHEAIQQPQAPTLKLQSVEDPDEIFGKLIEAELNSLNADEAKIKRRKLLQYLTNLE